jgi:hypothetical protein
VPPVPLKGTLAAEASDGDAIVSVPRYGPFREGEKITPVEQLAPAAKLDVHVFWMRLKGGVAVRVKELAGEPPVLISVTVCDGLDCPAATIGKRS